MKTLEEIEKYAALNYVPIARKDFVNYFKEVMVKNNYHSVLEIGSAIGYTCINLAMLDNVYVTTIEYNQERYNMCIDNIKDFNLESKINAIFGNALEITFDNKFDVIFVDAAKAKNINFVERFKNNLSENGIIFIDNIDMKDLKKMANPKKVAFYENKIEELKQYLANLDGFNVEYSHIGDGIAILTHNKK